MTKWAKGIPQAIRDLKPGDIVCDCNYRHKVISKIHYRKFPISLPKFFRHNRWIPRIFLILWEDLARKLGWVEIIDLYLIFEDGRQCSAMNCCEPANHTWKHPEDY